MIHFTNTVKIGLWEMLNVPFVILLPLYFHVAVLTLLCVVLPLLEHWRHYFPLIPLSGEV